MNIDDLTIAQAKELGRMFGGIAAPDARITPMIGQKVIVRAYRAGVLYGTLVSASPVSVVLSDARRLWYWEVKDKKGIALEDVANYGLSKNSKVTEAVKQAVILDAGEIMSTTADAQASIEGANAYRPS